MDTPPPIDLESYLARIGYAGDLAPTLGVLEALHLAHASHIPFENLDILLGRPIRIDLEGLQAKLVQGRRGGYCFEHNLLFAAVLETLGFSVTRLAARVRYGTLQLLPRTHMLLRVEADGSHWLADVGFGAEGLLKPIALATRQTLRRHDRCYRLVDAEGPWILQCSKADDWQDLYEFSWEPQYLVDYEVANYFVSTHPSSVFRRNLIAQLPTPEGRFFLKNRELSSERAGTTCHRTIESDDELLDVLSSTFGLDFPRGTRFQVEPSDQGPCP